MTVRLLVAEGVGRDAPPGARLVGASAGGAVLVLGAVAAATAAAAKDAAGAAAADAAPFTFALDEMLPHGLAVVGCVDGADAAGPGPSSSNINTWVTLDPSTGEFSVGATKAAATTLSPSSSSSTPLSLPPNDAFALVCVSMPRLRVAEVEELLDGDGAASLLFVARRDGGSIVLSPAAGSATTTPTTTATTVTELGDGCVTFTPLVDTTAAAGEASTAAPVFEFDDSGAAATTTPAAVVLLDALAVVPSSTPLADLARDHLVPALRKQLAVAKRVVVAAKTPKQGAAVATAAAAAAHFAPPVPPLGGALPLTLFYPLLPSSPSSTADESHLASVRRAAHATLGLPLDRPLLRLANAVAVAGRVAAGSSSSASAKTAKKLLNVHAAIPSPPPLSGPNVTTSLVQGSYEYCHYLQDGARDGGWGCAYRSCQTLCSWFRHQRFSSLPANPSHKEIQRVLVKLGDKPASFLGSNQWIGAIELGYVLEELLGVQSRVVTAQRGDEVNSKARQLAAHFQEHGTPVMVGGGVLAYTLLGVQYDEETGDAAFLILDPHYTGGDSAAEDLEKRIVGGGWVGWKRLGDKAAAGGELFVPDAFYNFLCPMRPKEV